MKSEMTKFRRAILAAAAGAAVCTADAADFSRTRLVNEGFEDAFEGWAAPGEGWSVAPGEGAGKSNALAWEGVPGRGPMQRLATEAGAKYSFGARVRTGRPGRGGTLAAPKIMFRWFDWNENLRGEAVATPSGDNDPNAEGWIRYEGIALPKCGPYGELSVEMPDGSDGRALLDDFYFMDEGGKTVGELVSSAYRDKACGGKVKFAVALNVNTMANPLEGLKPRFVFEGTDGKAFAAAPDEFAADKAVVEVDAARLKRGTSKAEFFLDAADGKSFGSASMVFSRPAVPAKRRVAVDSMNRLIVDGKPFFPLGMFGNVVTKEEMEIYRQGPFNCILPYTSTKESLDVCHEAGIKVIYDIKHLVWNSRWTCKDCKTREASLAAIRKCAMELRGHPALLAWYPCDESPLSHLPVLAEVYETLKSVDPDHPVYIAIDRPDHVRRYMSVFDAIGVDPYPVGNNRGGLETASGWAMAAMEGMYGLRPMWHVPQVYNWRWLEARRKAAGDSPELRFPTHDELVSMTWQPIAAGANGLVPYAFFEIRRKVGRAEFESLWKLTCDVMDPVRDCEDIFLSEPGPDVLDAPADFIWRTWSARGKTWVLVCSRSGKSMRATVRVGGKGGGLSISEFVVGNGVKPVGPDALEVSMPPFGVAFFALERK